MTNKHFKDASTVIYGSTAGFEETAARLNALAQVITEAPYIPVNLIKADAAIKALADHASAQDDPQIKDFAAETSAMVGKDANGGPTFVGDIYNTLLDSFTALNKTQVGAALTSDGKAHFEKLVRTRQIYHEMGHGGVASVSMELNALRLELGR